MNAKLKEDFCYAYAYNPFDFKYDYGDGKCDVTVSKHPKNQKEQCARIVMFSHSSYSP